MKKILYQKNKHILCLKFNLKMKLSVLFLLVTLFTVQANTSYSQVTKISLKLENVKVNQLIDVIESKSDFRFIYKIKDVDLERIISVQAKNEKIFSILDRVFDKTETAYSVIDRQIFLIRKSKDKPVDEQEIKQQDVIVKGNVIDESNLPMAGVTILVKGTATGTSTDFDGNYSLLVKDPNAILVFSYVGFETQEVPLEGQTTINIILKEDTAQLDEVVLVAYGTQKKESVVGAQSTIKSRELKAPVRDLSTAIAGKLAGVVATQRGGGPGADGADLFIRGIATFSSSPQGPLLVVDGVPDRSINNIDPEDVESFTVLKDATATAVYGTRGANGVILITTKSGKAGKPVVNAEINSAVTKFTELPDFIDGPTFMTLYNEGLTTRGQNPAFTQEEINLTASGVDPDLYPNVDWYDVLFRDFGTNNRITVNISGGSDKSTYYISAGYFGETGLFKTGDVEAFNSNLKLDRFNFTTNVDVNVTESTKIDFGINGFITNFNRPAYGGSVADIFHLATASAPHIIPPQYSNGQWPQLQGTLASPYMALTQSGVTNETRNTVRSNLRVTQSMDKILEGLSATAMFAFDVNSFNGLRRGRNLPTYWATGRDDDGNLITEISSTGSEDLSFSLGRYGDRRFYLETALNYENTFGKHDVSGLLLFNQSDYRDATSRVGTYTAAIPYRQRNLVGRVNYGFENKYFVEANFSYSGSDNFIPSKRYGFFPSFGAGWVISKEKFFEPVTDVMSFFKVRYSYGLSGNANINNPNNRFLYLSTIGDSGGYTFGVPGATRGYTGFGETRIGGNVKWETSYRHNLGVEMNFLNNDLKLIVELFKERREGILLRDYSIPYTSGFTTGNIPFNNVGKTKNQGIDVTLEYNKSWTEENFFQFRGTFNYNENEAVFDGLPEWRYPYLNRIGQPISQRFGYIATGLFENDDEIANAAVQAGDVRVGDIRYKDLNGDGIINSNDQTAIGYGSVPRIVYGISIGGGFKGFDVSLFFQGVAQVDFNYSGGFGTTPFSQGSSYGNMYTNVLDRWTPDNPNPQAFYPRLSTNQTQTTNYYTSTWWVKPADYVRLKQAEIGYTLLGEENNIKMFKKFRIFLSGTNLLTFSKWDFWDPELGDGRGATYPNITTYNLGVRLTF
ncbi:TonB-dependent receptor [Aestuariivivens insulae]|uniref:TonB-dependent receptor n=1 Tax=Aestuariivivens insulae TaxID=1621988 RepID=UPI001F5870E3|nr:TonB-dependent receptor [Aestuariivivens insulae]